VRKLFGVTLVSTALLAAACGKDAGKKTALSSDLKNDLALASAQPQTLQINSDELGPQSHRAPATKLVKATNAPHVVHSDRPTRKASARQAVAAEAPAPEAEVAVMAPAPDPTPAETEAPTEMPDIQPAPLPIPQQPGPGPSVGQSHGSTLGSILGGIAGAIARGAIIRGGGVDGDDCEPHGPTRVGGIHGGLGGSGVYRPQGGGYGGSRFPINPIHGGTYRP
jgi:hypothetical protein